MKILFGRSRREGVTPRLVRISCPVCDEGIKMPFVSTCGPIPYVHNTRARFRACRLVIIPDAVGHEHEVYPVGEDESFEDALPPHIRRWAAGLVEVA